MDSLGAWQDTAPSLSYYQCVQVLYRCILGLIRTFACWEPGQLLCMFIPEIPIFIVFAPRDSWFSIL